MKDEKTLEFFIHSGGYRAVTAAVPADFYDSWHRVSGVYDGEQLRLLIDGKQVATAPFSGPIDRSHHPVNIGRDPERMTEHSPTRMAHGAVDQVRIYHAALTADQLANDPKSSAVLALDFDTAEDKGTYLSYGAGQAGNDGILHPDRRLQPEAVAMGAVHAPIRFADVKAREGLFSVFNERSFVGSDDLVLKWQVEESGRVLRSGTKPLIAPAGGTTTIKVPRPPANPKSIERFLTVQAVLKKATTWADAGHVVATGQFNVGGKAIPGIASPNPAKPIKTTQTDDSVVVTGDRFEYTIDKKLGTLTSMKVRGVELLKKGPQLDVWRSPVSNENWGEANDWRSVGLERLETSIGGVTVTEGGNKVTIGVKSKVAAPGVTDASFNQALSYTVTGTGDIRLAHQVDPQGKMRTLPYLPRVGLTLGVKPNLEKFNWYGRGPVENYNDRKDGTPIGVFSLHCG